MDFFFWEGVGRCQGKLVGLNELLLPTATICGDRLSD